MKTDKTYSSYNHRRYSIPWIALVDPRTGEFHETARTDLVRVLNEAAEANG